MDIRLYFEKIREAETGIPDAFVIVSSLQTPDGGKAGNLTEVTRAIAAQLLVDGRARLATEDEARDYRERSERTRTEAEQALAKARMQFTLLTEQESRALRTQRVKS
jgi:phage terminase Nu1 subunit (DNA packaging protein)